MLCHLISGAHEWINEIPTAINANANLKAIHMLRKLHEKSIIRIGGDPYQERSAVVDDTPGQGTNYAPDRNREREPKVYGAQWERY